MTRMVLGGSKRIRQPYNFWEPPCSGSNWSNRDAKFNHHHGDFTICPRTTLGQTQISQYNWRTGGSDQHTIQTDVSSAPAVNDAPVARVAQIPNVRRNAVPAAPVMTRKPFLVSFRKNRQEGGGSQAGSAAGESAQSLLDRQPSLSDVDNYSLEAPSAPQVPAEVPSEVSSIPGTVNPEPTTAVKSNATKEKVSPYCNPPKKSRCNLGCERRLFPQHCSGLQVGGWMNLGYHNRNNILVNNRADQIALHQGWLYFDNAASSNQANWDTGYRADILYGLDAQDLQAFGNGPTGAPSGWDNDWDNDDYGWALPQLYVQFANYQWDVKIGKFFSPFGYEVIGAPDNFFYSHSFTMYNSEPFTMTGILAERKVSENRSYIFGATLGWDTGFENNSGGNAIIGTRYQPNEYVNLALTSSIGDSGARGSGRLTSGVAQLQLSENVSYVLQGDVLDLGTNQEFGIVQYLFRDINDCLKLGARLEWWKSDQFFADTKSTYNFTMGANYRANANITLRPELRFDWGAAAVDPGTPIIGIDAVMTF